MRTGDAQFIDQLAFQCVRIAAGGGLEDIGDALGAAVEALIEHGAAGGREHLVLGLGHFPFHRPGAALGGQFLVLTGGHKLGLRHQLEAGLLQLLLGVRADAVGDALHLRIAHAFELVPLHDLGLQGAGGGLEHAAVGAGIAAGAHAEHHVAGGQRKLVAAAALLLIVGGDELGRLAATVGSGVVGRRWRLVG